MTEATQLFIGGVWRDASDGATVPVENPATGEVLTSVADATPADGHAALTAAHEAQASWQAVAPRARGEILRSTYELLTQRYEQFAALMTAEMGKPLGEARGEVGYGAEFFRWFAEEAVRVAGRWSIAPDGGSRLLTMRRPVGPALLITPWNFPLAMGARKIAAAVAAGCTMVVKPATQTPLTTLALAGLMREAGLPDGVLNVVTTTRTAEVVEPLVRDPRLRKISFTGSTPVGRLLVEQSAEQLLRLSMELGGNAPFLVFADADLDAAVDGAMVAKMRNMGQACTAANRFLVHEAVAAEFTERFTARMAALRAGTDFGPLIDAAARAKVTGLVDDAVRRGATVRCGGGPVGDAGYFYAPTVLTDVPPGARLATEEIFGPVAPISTFTGEAEAIKSANDTEYGLAAYVFTKDLSRAVRVGEALDVGMIGVNQGVVSNPAAPFGGIKASGFGREGGAEGIDEYLETRYLGLAV